MACMLPVRRFDFQVAPQSTSQQSGEMTRLVEDHGRAKARHGWGLLCAHLLESAIPTRSTLRTYLRWSNAPDWIIGRP